jgi:sugar fermentation stimulation protein A
MMLLGHSMGSFLSRAAVVMHPGFYDALIIMGTGGPNPASSAGLLLTRTIMKQYGDMYISEMANNLIFASYNKRTNSDKEFAWLTRDEEMLAKHDRDPLCLFPFTVSAIHDLIAVQKGDKLINMDAQAPNKVFAEWAAHFEPKLQSLRGEYTYGQSRLDFCITTEEGLHLVEVKGVTLEEDGHTRFPDAPTERGIKHLRGLAAAAQAGTKAGVCFVLQRDDVLRLKPNDLTHPAFGDALREAAAAGVRILACVCHVTPESVTITHTVPVELGRVSRYLPRISQIPTPKEHPS